MLASGSVKEYKVGQNIVVEMPGGRLVEATVTRIIYKLRKRRFQVAFGNQKALIYEWQIVETKKR